MRLAILNLRNIINQATLSIERLEKEPALSEYTFYSLQATNLRLNKENLKEMRKRILTEKILMEDERMRKDGRKSKSRRKSRRKSKRKIIHKK
jgi:hypothetical protein